MKNELESKIEMLVELDLGKSSHYIPQAAREKKFLMAYIELLTAEIDKLKAELKELLIDKIDHLKAERNTASKKIGDLKKAGKDPAPAVEEMRIVGDKIQELDTKIRSIDKEAPND